MTQKLPPEQSRCHGFCCPQRAQCLRYTDRMGHDYSTKFVHRLCEGEGMEHYIPKKDMK